MVPFCKPQFHRRRVGARAAGGFIPTDVAKAYGLGKVIPKRTPLIGIVELGGGYNDSDNTTAFNNMGQQAPSMNNYSVSGATNSPGDDADGEVALDIQIAAGVAQYMTGVRCSVLMAWAPNNGGSSFASAIDALVAAKVDTVSISWGAAESQWSSSDRSVVGASIDRATTAGIPVFVASGDANSGDGLSGTNVDFPAAYPTSIGCGGTNLVVGASGTLTETVWNDGQGDGTGGGYSKLYTRPVWQVQSNVMRGVPDVCGNADPQTGWRIVLDGNVQVFGGTSAVAPLWAGLVAACKSAGFSGQSLASIIYKNTTAFNDTITGNNGQYQAGPGWDACTGLGSPKGSILVPLLVGSVVTPPPSPPPPVSPPPSPPPTPIQKPLFSLTFRTSVPKNSEIDFRTPVAFPAGEYDFTPHTTAHLVSSVAVEDKPVLGTHVSIDWQRLWAWIQTLVKILGPAAVPMIEALVAGLPLTDAQKKLIDGLIESLLNSGSIS